MTSPTHALPSPEHLEQRVGELFARWRVRECAVEVRWNGRLRTSVGRAFVQRGRIELNPRLLGEHPDQIPIVLAHEAAHVAAFRLYGPATEAHGRQWRALMRLAGFSPAITHDLPVPRARRRPHYLYLRVCDGCGARAILAAVRYGRCPGCGRRDSYLVLRAPATRAGRAALERMSVAEARRRCGTR